MAEVKTIFTLKFAGHHSPHRGRRAAVWAAAAAECRLVLQFSANSQWGRSAKIFYHHRQHQKSLDVVFQRVTRPKHICVYTFKRILIFVSRSKIFVTLKNICDTKKYSWPMLDISSHAEGGGEGDTSTITERLSQINSYIEQLHAEHARTRENLAKVQTRTRHISNITFFIVRVRGQRSQYILFNVLFTLDHQ